MLQLNQNQNNDNNINFDLNIYHNLKTVELIRGRYGYGFDLKGDRPSIIGSIRKNSPADLAGLKEGDLVIAINNTKVTDLDHDQVVRLIGQSKTNLVLQVTKVLRNNSGSCNNIQQLLASTQPLPIQTQQQQTIFNNNINNYEILYDTQSIQQQQPQQQQQFLSSQRNTNKKSKLFYYNNANYDYYLDPNQLNEYGLDDYDDDDDDEEDEEEEEEEDYEDEDDVFNQYDGYYNDLNFDITNSNLKNDESIESSEDDCSMQPFYVHKLKPLTNIINNQHQQQFNNNNNNNNNRSSNSKKKFKQSLSKNSLDYAFLNQQKFLQLQQQQQQQQQQQFKLAKSQQKKIQTANKNRLSLIQPSHQQHQLQQISNKYYLNVNDLYAILSPIIKPYIYNSNLKNYENNNNLMFNCNYIGTVHIPYDTLNNAPKLNSIRSSIEYFLTQIRTQNDEKTVCLTVYRDNLTIKDNSNQIMSFSSSQIGFCGKIKQLNDFFAIIILSLDKLTSSSCLLFRFFSQELHKIDLLLNLISKIYRNQNYVFNNVQTDSSATTTTTTTTPPPTTTTTASATITKSSSKDDLLLSDTIITSNLNKKYFSTKLNDINENDELCLKTHNNSRKSNQSTKFQNRASSFASLTNNETTNSNTSNNNNIKTINTNENKQPILTTTFKNNPQQKIFQRNTENTQSIKLIKENLTNLFLSKFNNNHNSNTENTTKQQQQQQQQQQPQKSDLAELAADIKQKKTLSLPHNYNLLDVKQDLILPENKNKQKKLDQQNQTPNTNSKFLTTQKLKSKFKKTTFQFLKSKPPIIISSTVPAPTTTTTTTTNTANSKFNSILATSSSINNLNLFNIPIVDNNRRRLSDYHRPTKSLIVTEDDPLAFHNQKTTNGSIKRAEFHNNNNNNNNNNGNGNNNSEKLNSTKVSISNSLTDVNEDLKSPINNEIGRVTKWAIGFEKLLEDPIGLQIFTEFLKKEFSQENIEFWVKCENFKQIQDDNEMKLNANEIWNTYLDTSANYQINVDNKARSQCKENLLQPNNTMFEAAQLQIFTLMKYDSYSRFLKSQMYKDCIVYEMESKPLNQLINIFTTPQTLNTNIANNNNNNNNNNNSINVNNNNNNNNANNVNFTVNNNVNTTNTNESTSNRKDKKRSTILPWTKAFIKWKRLSADTPPCTAGKDKNKEQQQAAASTPIIPSTVPPPVIGTKSFKQLIGGSGINSSNNNQQQQLSINYNKNINNETNNNSDVALNSIDIDSINIQDQRKQQINTTITVSHQQQQTSEITLPVIPLSINTSNLNVIRENASISPDGNFIINDQHKLCRVLCSHDGSSTVIQINNNNTGGMTVLQALAKIYHKKQIPWYKCDLYFVNDYLPIDPYGDATQLCSREIYLEERCVFVLSLIPIAINLCIKAKFKRTIQSILQPILDLYQINLINCVAYTNSNNGVLSVLNITDLCSIIDNQHLFIVHKHQSNFLSPAEINNYVNVSINDFIPSNFKETFIQFDEHGILKHINQNSRRTSNTINNTPVITPNSIKNQALTEDQEKAKLLELLNKAHNTRLDDQRGLIDAKQLEIPEFLLNSTTKYNDNESQQQQISSSTSSSPLNSTKITTRNGNNVNNASRSRSPIILLNEYDIETHIKSPTNKFINISSNNNKTPIKATTTTTMQYLNSNYIIPSTTSSLANNSIYSDISNEFNNNDNNNTTTTFSKIHESINLNSTFNKIADNSQVSYV